MPEKPLTVATYAAGASLAAITLIYVFAPTYFLDGNSATTGGGGLLTSRKKGVVGLANPANDCFINSVLQALAGLGDLRSYLIRELHRRRVDQGCVNVYATTPVPPPSHGTGTGTGTGTDVSAVNASTVGASTVGATSADAKGVPVPSWKLEGLQKGIVTQGLKEMLDGLNERPIHKKTISATPFVRTLETAFRQKISRQQQDAQEFLQVVAERLCDEYHAGPRARARMVAPAELEGLPTGVQGGQEDEEAFPMEGTLESQIECLTCGFKPKPTPSTFCTLTLNVPQVASTTLNACFDGMFKTEYIDDFKCEKCRLLHAVSVLQAELRKPNATKAGLQRAIAKLQRAVETDPETPPPGVELPDVRHAPKRRIARHVRLTGFPKILAIHLSRSIFDPGSYSQKNSAKVAFQERLPLGGLLTQRRYRLLGLVTHKGSHSSGHYESFRRQFVAPPFSNPATFQPSGFYGPSWTPRRGPNPKPRPDLPPPPPPPPPPPSSSSSSPDAHPHAHPHPHVHANEPRLSPDSSSSTTGSSRLRGRHSSPSITTKEDRSRSRGGRGGGGGSSSTSRTRKPPKQPPKRLDQRPDTTAAAETNSILSSARSTLSRITSRPSTRSSKQAGPEALSSSSSSSRPATAATAAETGAGAVAVPVAKPLKRPRHHDRWWRISDDKVKEASTREVLGMQREVYLLFYELQREDP